MKIKKIHNKLEIKFNNNKNEKIIIHVKIQQHDLTYKNSLMNLWVKNKYINQAIPKTWHLELYVYNKKGNCYNKYNPCIQQKTNKINFDHILPATFGNLKLLLKKCKEMANA
ncbi:MAG: hypothetical protein IJZ29_05290 [Clostridia bacterium]|nr:hypothetical protein [Clostridia bacterium]